ncbi:hypothetical protein pb186bvf_007772 [Paramecium bursaria]
MYVPQLVIPQSNPQANNYPQSQGYTQQVNYNLNQVYPQQTNQVQIQGNQYQQDNYYQQQNVSHINHITLNHQNIKNSQPLEQGDLRIKITFLLLLTNMIGLTMTIIANNCVEFVRFLWNPMQKRFEVTFFIFLSAEILSVLAVFLYLKTPSKEPIFNKAIYAIFSLCNGFIFSGAFATSYRQAPYYDYHMTRLDYGQNIVYCLGYVCILFASILVILKKSPSICNFKQIALYIIVPNLIYTIIVPYLYEQNMKYVTFYVIFYVFTSAFGFYYVYILIKYTIKGYKNIRTDEETISSVILVGLLIVPCYKFDQALPDEQDDQDSQIQ